MRWLFLFALIGSGCVRIAEERAQNEDRIGRASAAGLSVDIADGLAAIRSIEAGRVELWGQAPSLSITLDAEAAGDWELTLRNAMPTAQLSGLPATAVPQELPTRLTWRVPVPAGRSTLTIAPPEAATQDAFRIVVFADIQDRLDGVQDIYARMKEETGVHFGLISGDLTEQGDPKDLRRFQQEMETLPFPLFATLGNHELGNGSAKPPFHELFGRGSFSFEHRGVHFTLLDAASATIAPRTYDKLKGWLSAGKDRLHLAMMHIPPLDFAGLRNGAFASRAEAHKLLGMFARANVDLTIYGHVHTYKAFKNVGIEAFITGGGGAIPERLDGIGRHFLSIDVDPSAQRFRSAVVRITPAD